MAISAGGWVEVKVDWREDHWVGVIRIDELISVNYDMFGCLFDVANYTGLTAPAPVRGLPPLLSLESRHYDLLREEQGGTQSQSWITWAELKSVDLDEVGVDRRAHHYQRDANDELVYLNKKTRAPYTPDVVVEGMTWEADNIVYKIHAIKRRDIFDKASDWKLLFALMRTLEGRYLPDDIRLVVWFW